jgi:hypothetical protein
MISQIKLHGMDAIRKKAGLGIDPKTAELLWCWGQMADPYDDLAEIPDECYCIGLLYFARSPGSDNIWVEFGDLPDATVKALRERLRAEPRWNDGNFFDAASDEDHLSKMASNLTDAQLTMTINSYEAWHGGEVDDWAAVVAELEGQSAFHLELEARRSRAARRLGEHPSTSTEVSMTDV